MTHKHKGSVNAGHRTGRSLIGQLAVMVNIPPHSMESMGICLVVVESAEHSVHISACYVFRS